MLLHAAMLVLAAMQLQLSRCAATWLYLGAQEAFRCLQPWALAMSMHLLPVAGRPWCLPVTMQQPLALCMLSLVIGWCVPTVIAQTAQIELAGGRCWRQAICRPPLQRCLQLGRWQLCCMEARRPRCLPSSRLSLACSHDVCLHVVCEAVAVALRKCVLRRGMFLQQR